MNQTGRSEMNLKPHNPSSEHPKQLIICKNIKPSNLFKIIFLGCLLLFSSFAHADFTPTDVSIVDVIQTQMMIDNDVSDVDVTVLCHNGVVRLIGRVDDNEEARRLIDIAHSTAGVSAVDSSQLVVSAP